MSRTPPVYSPSGVRAISPSQIETYKDCPRKWGYRVIDGIEAPPSPSAVLGDLAHKQGERYFKSAILPDYDTPEGAIFGATIPHWPDPRKVTVESERAVYVEVEGVPFHGFQDVGWYEGEVYTVGDLKTTSDLRYAKTPEVLRTDPQALVYGLAAVHREGLDTIRLKWVYSRTRGARKALPVELRMSAQELQASVEEHVLPIAKEIIQARELPAAWDLPQVPSTCPKYGGCWYGKAGVCVVDPIKALGGLIMSEELKKKLLAAKAAQKQAQKEGDAVPLEAPPQEETTATEVAINPPTPTPRSAILEKLQGLAGGKPTPPPVVPDNQPVKKLSTVVGSTPAPTIKDLVCRSCGEAEDLDSLGYCSDCTPKFHVKPNSETVAAVETPKFPVKPDGETVAVVEPPTPPRKGPDVVLVDVRSPMDPKPLPETPGKKAFDAYRTFRGGKNHDGTPTPPWSALTDGVRQAWEVAAQTGKNSPILCVGCIPDCPYMDIRELIKTAHEEVKKAFKVPDYRLVDYGKGQGALVAAMDALLENTPLTGYLYADSKDPTVSLVLGCFVRRVDTVIQGVG